MNTVKKQDQMNWLQETIDCLKSRTSMAIPVGQQDDAMKPRAIHVNEPETRPRRDLANDKKYVSSATPR
ncbi:hypothetical protein HII31_01057 [Pseudocercospora fuligena]|uniref:Uncharacterized protein n=1 Tax=Pseudocercospora fuligena TaxID=685502 RepID=A0A8H6RUN6_9PEZI|nr:hypothetical protein HII31_01057 [Pseudocercospora fuligena]